MIEIFKTIADASTGEFKDRGSKFIAYSFPINNTEDAAAKILFTKTEHPKARHYCFAYRLGTDQLIFRASDDGEPSGTAGKPILGQIDSFGLTNVIVIVVRYFGGVLLGTGGLINAYREAAKISLAHSKIIEQTILYNVTAKCEYNLLPVLMKWIKKYAIKINEQKIADECVFNLSVDKEQLKLLRTMNGITTES